MYYFKMFHPSTLLSIILLLSPHGSYQICEFMTDEEIYSIFQTQRDAVPQYQVVPVLHSLNKQHIKNPQLHFKSFGKDVMLYLWPAEGMLFGQHTPVYTVASDKSSPKGLRYTKYNKYGIYYAYQDQSNNAALIVRQGTNDSYKFDGTFGQHFVIRSLPERIIEEIINKNESYHQQKLYPNITDSHGNYSQTDHHLVIKMDDLNYILKNFTNNSLIDYDSYNRDKRETEEKQNSDIAYPELLTIVTYDIFKSFRSDVSEVLVYLTAFWNGADLRYRSLVNPKVRLNMATIIIALDRNATPYLDNYRVDESQLSIEAMQAMGHYLYSEERFERGSYDIAIAITRSVLCEWSKLSENSSCIPLRGISKVGSACVWDDRKKSVESLALIHDEGFNGVATAAHELGHVMGVPHDGSPAPDYIGGPGATKCSWEDGYLMSSQRFGINAFRWSNCSLECFQFFLKQPVAKCLYNEPKFDTALPRILPGTLLSLDEQCYRGGGLEACYHDARACILLYCTKPDEKDSCFATAPAAEGSKCGDEKICIGGECIDESQWKHIDVAMPQ